MIDLITALVGAVGTVGVGLIANWIWRPAANVCAPGRDCGLTGSNGTYHNGSGSGSGNGRGVRSSMRLDDRIQQISNSNEINGEASQGGYMDDTTLQTSQQGKAGHVSFWETQPMPQIQTETREEEWWNDTTSPRESFVEQSSGSKWMAENGLSIHQDQSVEVAQHVHVRLNR